MLAANIFLTSLVVFLVCATISGDQYETRAWVYIPGCMGLLGMIVGVILALCFWI